MIENQPVLSKINNAFNHGIKQAYVEYSRFINRRRFPWDVSYYDVLEKELADHKEMADFLTDSIYIIHMKYSEMICKNIPITDESIDRICDNISGLLISYAPIIRAYNNDDNVTAIMYIDSNEYYFCTYCTKTDISFNDYIKTYEEHLYKLYIVIIEYFNNLIELSKESNIIWNGYDVMWKLDTIQDRKLKWIMFSNNIIKNDKSLYIKLCEIFIAFKKNVSVFDEDIMDPYLSYVMQYYDNIEKYSLLTNGLYDVIKQSKNKKIGTNIYIYLDKNCPEN